MLLFPTFWVGEGMPGTIIDALSAGLPVIARNWKYCDEMIKHGQTGYIYDYDKPELLVDWITYAVENVESVNKMRRNCLHDAKQYDAEQVMNMILARLE